MLISNKELNGTLYKGGDTLPSLANHHAGKFAKLLYLGDSGTGKTGSLVSLVKAGYKLRILDMDNGLDVLRAYVTAECSDKLSNVDYETQRDQYKATPTGPKISGVAKAFVASLGLMTKWTDDTVPAEWGPNQIFVVDTLTGLGRAAFEWAKIFTQVGAKGQDGRAIYGTAQQALENVLSLLTSEAFHSNVIVIAHVQFQEASDGTIRGYANSIGKALGPIIPTYFNNMILARSHGSGKNVSRSILTAPTSMIDLKNSAPFKVDAEYPLGTGLATLFEKLKET